MFQFVKDALSIIYPIVCAGCNAHLSVGEKAICVNCLEELPYTNQNFANNLIANKLKAIAPIEGVFALTYFNTGNKIEQIIHQLKYRNNTALGLRLGIILGEHSQEILQDYSIIIPVPLHKRKKAQRGYNQAELIAKGLQQNTNIPLNTTLLIKQKNTTSQTRKSRIERYNAMKNVFRVTDNNKLENKNVILIDDIITTGATAISCAETLFNAGANKVLIVAIGYANPF